MATASTDVAGVRRTIDRAVSSSYAGGNSYEPARWCRQRQNGDRSVSPARSGRHLAALRSPTRRISRSGLIVVVAAVVTLSLVPVAGRAQGPNACLGAKNT